MNKKEKNIVNRLVEKVERACVCWRTNQNFMKAEDWRELEKLVKETKEEVLK
jgi:hypothetical protein